MADIAREAGVSIATVSPLSCPASISSVEAGAFLDTLPLRRKVDGLGTESVRALLGILEEDPRNDE